MYYRLLDDIMKIMYSLCDRSHFFVNDVSKYHPLTARFQRSSAYELGKICIAERKMLGQIGSVVLVSELEKCHLVLPLGETLHVDQKDGSSQLS